MMKLYHYIRWFWIWTDCFFRFVWRHDGYFDPRAKYVTISTAAFQAKVIADTCFDIAMEQRLKK